MKIGARRVIDGTLCVFVGWGWIIAESEIERLVSEAPARSVKDPPEAAPELPLKPKGKPG